MSLWTDFQTKIHVTKSQNSYHFFYEGCDHCFPTLEKVYRYFRQETPFDTLKFYHGSEKKYLHFMTDDQKIYRTRKELRACLSDESGGAWCEDSENKKRYFLEKRGLFGVSFTEVNPEAFNKINGSLFQRVWGIGLGILAVAPKIIKTALLISPVQAQALGTEFQVNTYFLGQQEFPKIAALADKGFVVVWHSLDQDGDSWGVFGQQYDAIGYPIGSEFQINTYTRNAQQFPDVSSFLDGGYIVAWRSYGQDQNEWGVFAQLYTANSTKHGLELQLNSIASGWQWDPSVATLENGNFVAAWNTNHRGGDWEIDANVFNRTASPQRSEIWVNTVTSNGQSQSSIASLGEFGFVIVWQSTRTAGRDDIKGQRFNISGYQLGGEFLVNTYRSNQNIPSVAGNSIGDFLVVWESEGQDGDGFGIYGQKYNATGHQVGEEFRVNNFTMGDQLAPDATYLENGDYVIVWESESQDGDGAGVFGQRYHAEGIRWGETFQVNTNTVGNQKRPSITSLPDGGFVVVWHSDTNQDGSSNGVFGQRYDVNGTPVGPPPTVQTNLSSSSQLISNISDSQQLTEDSSQRDLNGSISSSLSQQDVTPSSVAVSQTNSIAPIITMFVYQEPYTITFEGQTIGSFIFSGGTGELNPNNFNIISIELDPDITSLDGVAIPLFTIPEGEELSWEGLSIQIDSECFTVEGELVQDELESRYNVLFNQASCSLYLQATKVSAIPLLSGGSLL